jgi:hypothetical protein
VVVRPFFLLTAALVLGGCSARISPQQGASGVSSAIPKAAQNPQFLGSEPLPRASLGAIHQRPRAPAPSENEPDEGL